MDLLKDGYTLIHEHVTIDLSKVKENDDCHLRCFDETVEEFKKLYEYGVRNIVDVTADGMGRDVAFVERVAKETGINILHATGVYKEPFLPDYVHDMSVQELANHMVKEITEGIEDTGVKASVLGEIGTSKDDFKDSERKVFEAAILAAKQTDIVISTHTSLGTCALEQAELFLESGLDPSKIIIGHQDLSNNINQIKTLIDKGFYVAFDTIGKNNYLPDEERIKMLLELEKTNRIDKVCLSLDITRKSALEVNGGIGYSYIFEKFIPACEKSGISKLSIDKMLKLNPRNLFGGVQ